MAEVVEYLSTPSDRAETKTVAVVPGISAGARWLTGTRLGYEP